jgi:hypothetical protein
LRLYQLNEQIIADDEWHALHAVRDLGFGSIAQHFGDADISIPMALFYKIVANTVGLSELIMRLPVIFVGLASLVVFPLLVRERFDRTTSLLFSVLLTISPLHIYYSRYARPYAISLFCAFCGVYAFALWWSTRNRWWKYAYATCAIVGPYFHLTVLPVLFAPLALTTVLRLWKRGLARDSSTTEILRLILFTGGCVTFLLLAPISADFGSLLEKSQHGQFDSQSSIGALGLFLGMQAPLAQVLTGTIIVLGSITLVRKDPRLALLLGTSALVALLLIVITRPTGIEYPIVVARYTLFWLPVMILMQAIGLQKIGSYLSGIPSGAKLMWVTWVIVSIMVGPLRRVYYAPNNFMNHAAFQYYPYFDAQRNPYVRELSRPASVSSFYFKLGRFPAGSLRILEVPWFYEWQHNPYPFYQQVHHQRVAIGFVKAGPSPAGETPPFDSRFRFRNFVHLLDPKDVCAHDIDRVIFHKDLERELVRPAGREFSEELSILIPLYEREYGPPVFEDDKLVVLDAKPFCHGIRP